MIQRYTSEIMSICARIDSLDTDVKTSTAADVKSAYATVRVDYLAKLRASVDSLKSRLEDIVTSKASAQ